MDWIYPKRLEAGMTIAFTVPASATLESLDALQAQVEAWGCKAVFGPSCYRSGEYGGTAAEQAKELNDFLTDSSCDAVIAVRGGYGCARYVDRLDFDGIRKAAKPFVGYSDCTVLLNAIGRYSRLVIYHGPMGVDWLRENRESDVADLHDLLTGVKTSQAVSSVKGLASGEMTTGRLFGGNATVLCSLGGTPYTVADSDWDNGFLVLEDVGEPPYKLDRLLQQLRLQGVLRRVKGILVGTFAGCIDDETGETYDVASHVYDYAMDGRAETAPKPVVASIPLGHGAPHKALPMGALVTLSENVLTWERP